MKRENGTTAGGGFLSALLMMGLLAQTGGAAAWADRPGSTGAGNAVPDDRELVDAAASPRESALASQGVKTQATHRCQSGGRDGGRCQHDRASRLAQIRRWCLGASARIDDIFENAAEQANAFGAQAMIEALDTGLDQLKDEWDALGVGEADSFLYRAVVRGIALSQDLGDRLDWRSLPAGDSERDYRLTGHAHGLELYFRFLKDVAWTADRDLARMYDDDECLYGGWGRGGHGRCGLIVFGAARRLLDFVKQQLEVPFQQGKLVVIGARGVSMPSTSTFGPSEVFLTLVQHLAAASAADLESRALRDYTTCLAARLTDLSEYARRTMDEGTAVPGGRLGRRLRTVFERGNALLGELQDAQYVIFGGCSHDEEDWAQPQHRCRFRGYTCGRGEG